MDEKLKEWFLKNTEEPEKLELFLFLFDCMFFESGKRNASKEKALFLVSTQTQEELVEIVNRLHCHVDYSDTGCLNLDQHDYELAEMLNEMYSLDQIWNSEIVEIGGYYFVFSKDDYWRFCKTDEEELQTAVESGLLINPTFVEYDEDGELLLD